MAYICRADVVSGRSVSFLLPSVNRMKPRQFLAVRENNRNSRARPPALSGRCQPNLLHCCSAITPYIPYVRAQVRESKALNRRTLRKESLFTWPVSRPHQHLRKGPCRLYCHRMYPRRNMVDLCEALKVLKEEFFDPFDIFLTKPMPPAARTPLL